MTKKNQDKTGLWATEEVRMLKKIFRNNSNAVVAARIGRTPQSIERKASRLQLTKTKKYLKTLGR